MTKTPITCLLALCLTGCGTVYNSVGDHSQTDPGSIYGGTSNDVAAMFLSLMPEGGDVANLPGSFFPLGLLDLPLSFVADTLLLPGTLVYAAVRSDGGDEAEN